MVISQILALKTLLRRSRVMLQCGCRGAGTLSTQPCPICGASSWGWAERKTQGNREGNSCSSWFSVCVSVGNSLLHSTSFPVLAASTTPISLGTTFRAALASSLFTFFVGLSSLAGIRVAFSIVPARYLVLMPLGTLASHP